MTLKELSAQYEAAAQPLRARLHDLRGMLARTNDPNEIWHIKRRIKELTPMLTQMNDLSWMLEHYYERGGADRDERYGFCGKSKPKKTKRKADETLAPDLRRRIDRLAARDFCGLLLRDENNSSDSEGKGGRQKHRLQNPETFRTENSAVPEIHPAVTAFEKEKDKND